MWWVVTLRRSEVRLALASSRCVSWLRSAWLRSRMLSNAVPVDSISPMKASTSACATDAAEVNSDAIMKRSEHQSAV